MRRISIAFVLALAMGLLAVPAAFAAQGPQPTLNFGQELNASQCGNGTLVIDVTMKVVNDADSGFGGYWALDNYTKHVQVWQTGEDTFCAVASYMGEFTSVAGTSPSGNSMISDGVTGTMQGGYRTTQFTGTLDPQLATHGNIGTFDYTCTITGGIASGCNYFSWVDTYFTNASGLTFDWWGWIYHAGNNGTWVNSSDYLYGLGDITG